MLSKYFTILSLSKAKFNQGSEELILVGICSPGRSFCNGKEEEEEDEEPEGREDIDGGIDCEGVVDWV